MAKARAEPLLPWSAHLGRVAGIPIGLHFSWFIIAALISLSLAARFGMTHPEWGPALVWGAAIVTALLFFITLLAHELGHAVVARARGIPVRSITLFALGGVANIEKEANSARTEFLIAIVGPLVSVVIGLIALAASQFLGQSADSTAGAVASSVCGWLGSINLLLALFNLVPGFPLDGGRVLRAILWSVYKDGERATRHAARAGQFVALLFIIIGGFQFFSGMGVGGLWLAFIGWFLLGAAQATYERASITDALRDVRVGEIMANDCATVEAGTSVRSIVDDLILRTGWRCVIVQRDGRVVGLVTPRDVRSVDRHRWGDISAVDVMRPLETLRAVTPDTSATDAYTTMAREHVSQLPVMSGGRLQGMVSRGRILHRARN